MPTSDSPIQMPADKFTADQKQHRADNRAIEQYANTALYGLVPIAGVIGYAGSALPPGYLNCNGAAVSRHDYAALFSIIGTTYGVGDGSTTFNVPTFAQARALFGGTAGAPGTGGLLIRTGAT